MNIFADYPDIISNALIPMIIAIFALVFPLLIQVITRIDDKYNSTRLIDVFKKDKITRLFLLSLLIAILSYIVWFLQLHPLYSWGWVIDNSALLFVIISTLALILMTILIARLIYIYFVPERLINRLISLHNNTGKEDKKIFYFEAISKILFYSINNADEPLARISLEFYYGAFILFRKGKEGQPIEYPQAYYDAIFEANELLCSRKKKTISYFNDSTLFHLFLDEYQKTVISPKTYGFLWNLIVQSIYYGREDFIIAYWQKAHQLFSLFMQKIYPDYDYSTFPPTVTNQKEINERDKIREDFLEFHYVLGALLMYKEQYSVIKEIMYFTHSQPPRYVLVPERMEEVILQFMRIGKNDFIKPFYYKQRYWFPDIYGVNSDDIIKMWIKRYLAILFIRQYTLHEYYVNSNTLTMPNPPKELSELNRWKDELDYLKYLVNEYLSKKDILEELGFSFMFDKKWFSENNKVEPSELIDNFKKEIENNFNKIKNQQLISHDKEIVFKENTKSILKPVFEKYSDIFQNNNIGKDCQRYSINGQHYILEKAAFGENQDVSYLNSDTITAEAVAQQFNYYALNIFILIFPQKFILIEKDLFPAIDNLNINPNDFVIISVGLYLDYFKSLHINGLNKKGEKWFYGEMEIIEMGYVNQFVSQSLFVLKKEDLPNMIFKEIKDHEYLRKFNLGKIDETFNIYTGLNDLNKEENKKLKDEIEKNSTEKDLSQKVLACVDIDVEIQCKKNTRCVQLKVFSQFDDRVKPNKLDEVITLWSENEK